MKHCDIEKRKSKNTHLKADASVDMDINLC